MLSSGLLQQSSWWGSIFTPPSLALTEHRVIPRESAARSSLPAAWSSWRGARAGSQRQFALRWRPPDRPTGRSWSAIFACGAPNRPNLAAVMTPSVSDYERSTGRAATPGYGIRAGSGPFILAAADRTLLVASQDGWPTPPSHPDLRRRHVDPRGLLLLTGVWKTSPAGSRQNSSGVHRPDLNHGRS